MNRKLHGDHRFLILLAVLMGFLISIPNTTYSQQATERLVLKDGGYQSVAKYELQGDRVHYLSAERYEWEDIPSSLIDWDATKKYNEELAAGKLRTHIVETPEEKEVREKEEANSPEIAPGVNLPGTGGVFLFDQFQGKPELAEIVQNGSEPSKDAKKSVLRSAINPLSANKQALLIKGEHAQVQSHSARPVIYIDIDEGQINSALGDRFKLIRVMEKQDNRLVGNVKVSVSGKISQQANFVPVRIEKLGTGEWIKLDPAQDLSPGEYAVVEMLTPEEMNLYVWDFGVNPKAPANPNTVQPAASR
jgi:hypothetical protein